jgi:hypothetical protein
VVAESALPCSAAIFRASAVSGFLGLGAAGLFIEIDVCALAATLATSQKYRLLALAGRGHVAEYVAATT